MTATEKIRELRPAPPEYRCPEEGLHLDQGPCPGTYDPPPPYALCGPELSPAAPQTGRPAQPVAAAPQPITTITTVTSAQRNSAAPTFAPAPLSGKATGTRPRADGGTDAAARQNP